MTRAHATHPEPAAETAPRASTPAADAAPLAASAVRPLRPADVLRLQRAAGNRAVGRLLAARVQRQEDGPAPPTARAEPMPPARAEAGPEAASELPEEEILEEPSEEAAELGPDEARLAESEREATQSPPAIPVGDGHHVTVRQVAGRFRLGVASEFTQAAHIIATLLDPGSPLSNPQRATVRGIRDDVNDEEARMNGLWDDYWTEQDTAKTLRRIVTVKRKAGLYGTARSSVDVRHRRYGAYLAAVERARHQLQLYRAQTVVAVNAAKDAIVQLWDIGKDFLPTHLMPVGEVYRDKAVFGGDTVHYRYHRGTPADPIPITWYKDPAHYPRLRLEDGTVVNFGAAFTVGGQQFGLSGGNVPAVDWDVQKTAHNESREGQKQFNDLLIDNDVEVEKGGAWRSPPLGNAHQFDGDHVKDLGFGGADRADNYWPLDSTINRRAFTGYNSGYVVHYVDATGTHRSRSIGGLVGKWFRVKRFLGRNAGPIPVDGAAAGGTPK